MPNFSCLSIIALLLMKVHNFLSTLSVFSYAIHPLQILSAYDAGAKIVKVGMQSSIKMTIVAQICVYHSLKPFSLPLK